MQSNQKIFRTVAALTLAALTLAFIACGGASGNGNNSNFNPAAGFVPRFVYTSNITGDNLSQFRTNPDGTLAALTPATVSTGTAPQGPYFATSDPLGHYLFVPNSAGKNVAAFLVNSDGTVSSNGSFALSNNALVVCVDPTGKFAYAPIPSGNSIAQFVINSDGTLSPTIPATIAAGPSPTFCAADSAGHVFVTVTTGTVGVSTFTIGSNGVLTPVASSFAAVTGIQGLTVHGGFLYATSAGSGIHQFAINPDGTLSALASPTVAGAASPVTVAITPGGNFAYEPDSANALMYEYAVNTDGTLSPLAAPTQATAAKNSGAVVDPTGKYLYVGQGTANKLLEYSINSDGTLTALSVASLSAGKSASFPIAVARQ